jgi:predicted enzyme related to lactoylglutathione lyase
MRSSIAATRIPHREGGPSVPAHPIVHIEIPASDLEKGSRFYADVFDWQIDSSWPTYPQFRAEGGPGGGFVDPGAELSDPPFQYTPGQVLLFLATDDIEGTLARVEEHGGKALMPRKEIPDVGFWAVFEDPSGNRVALFDAAQHAGG